MFMLAKKVREDLMSVNLKKPIMMVAQPPARGSSEITTALIPLGNPFTVVNEVSIQKSSMIFCKELSPLDPDDKQNIDNYIKATTGLSTASILPNSTGA